jgi:hypothetical protein
MLSSALEWSRCQQVNRAALQDSANLPSFTLVYVVEPAPAENVLLQVFALVFVLLNCADEYWRPLPACYRAKCTNKEAYDSIDAFLALNMAGKSLRGLGVVHETLADRLVPDPNFLRANKSERHGKRSKHSKNKN